MTTDLLPTLAAALARVPEDAVRVPDTARRGAVLVLLRPLAPDRVEVLYTRRQAHLSSHPGQISFPGGRVDPGEGIVEAALREANEEVGLDPATVTVMGRLPAFYIPPSRFWMSAVVARWDAPHDLVPSEAEVAEVIAADTDLLRDPERWRSVPLSAAGTTWAWQLAPQRLLWGATAVVTGVLMDLMAPGWHDGTAPADLPVDRHVRPWEDPEQAGLSRPTGGPPARLADVEALEVPHPADGPGPDDLPLAEHIDRWAAGVADAVRRLRRRGPGPVVVLAGPGVVGRVGRRAADLLGADTQVVETGAADTPDGGVDMATLVGAGVIVDAMLGRGLKGLLRDPLLAVVDALRQVSAPIVAVDLPTGIDPRSGVVGTTVSADVTVTDHRLVPGHVASGAMPFVADLYVVTDDGSLRRATVLDRSAQWGE